MTEVECSGSYQVDGEAETMLHFNPERAASERDVKALLRHYLDAFHQSDDMMMANVLHADADLRSLVDGQLRIMSRDEYLTLLAGREPLPSKVQRGEVLGWLDKDMSYAALPVPAVGRPFRDSLTVARTKSGWKIISKTYAALVGV